MSFTQRDCIADLDTESRIGNNVRTGMARGEKASFCSLCTG